MHRSVKVEGRIILSPLRSSRWNKTAISVIKLNKSPGGYSHYEYNTDVYRTVKIEGRIILSPLRSSRWNNTAISLSVIKMSKVQVVILTRIAYGRVHCTVQIEGAIIPSPLRSSDWSKTEISVMKNDPNSGDCG